ncbi:response regulator transcription factor [Pseudoalteromonas sp. L1]|uniref:LuxR C-terminal-related transcriptional regulator n=1 Tax=Pseudoalteromonas sp. L1 TaxID=195716 RepID=UPI001F20731D|nr:response regulator transcription factor [Pseudoalteromonas sp. L1]
MSIGNDILLVDDHPMVATAIKMVLAKSTLVNEVHAVASQKEALQFLKIHNIALAILDIELEDSDGFSLYKRAVSNGFAGKVLFLSAKHDKHIIRTAAKLGAQGFVNKAESLEDISAAVEMILRGYTFFPQEHLIASEKDIDELLTERELAVMNYLLQGLSNKDIGEKLFISNKTVSTYKAKIFEKLEVDSIISLAKLVKDRAIF